MPSGPSNNNRTQFDFMIACLGLIVIKQSGNWYFGVSEWWCWSVKLIHFKNQLDMPHHHFSWDVACHLWLARCWCWQNLHFLTIYGICKIDFPILLGHLLQYKVCLHVVRRTAAGLIHGYFLAKSTFSVHCNFSLTPHQEKRKMFVQPRHRQVMTDFNFCHCLM